MSNVRDQLETAWQEFVEQHPSIKVLSRTDYLMRKVTFDHGFLEGAKWQLTEDSKALDKALT